MTEKDLKRLSRADLLEMLIDQSVELKKAQEKLKDAQEELDSRRIAIDEAGTLAEAALKLNGIFEAAQASCKQYTDNIRDLNERQDAICRKREEESIRKAELLQAETEKRCAAMEAEAMEKYKKMLAKAEADLEKISPNP